MSKDQPAMTKPGILRMPPYILLIISALILGGCGAPATETTTPESSATAEPSPTAFVFPTLRPTATPDLSTSQACIDCHSDQQRLIDTADQVEVQEVESSGEG